LFLASIGLALTAWAAGVRAQDEDPGQRGEGAVPRGGAGARAQPGPPAAPPAQPAVQMPKLVHFEPAPFPPEAQKQGIQADVVLRLTIDATGKVTQAEVIEPAGRGFDEAARAASLQFRFEPATRAGKPVPVRILYKYSFTLTEVAQPEPAPEPGAPRAPKPGNLGGWLRIAGTNVPLAGAEVEVTTPDGRSLRATTDALGRWELSGLPPGAYRIRATAEGFQVAETTEQVGAAEQTDITLRLPPASEGLEVTVRGERPPREVTRRTIERREIDRIPGTSGDALRSIQSLPGVARPPGLAGLLIVRGSAPQDTETFVDGSSVPLIYHFGGLSSTIPTELLDKIDFYPGNFSARYGRVMGGIVDVSLREPDTSCTGDYGKRTNRTGCYHGMAQVDLIDARALVQGPLPIDGWTFAVGARRSWIDAWITPVLEEAGAGVTTAPVYWDYQVITETKPARNARLSLRAYGTDDRLEILIKDPVANDPAFGGNVTFGTASHRLQMLYEDQISRDVELRTMLSAGRDTLDFSIGNFMFELEFYPINARSELAMKVEKGFVLNAGMDYLAAPVTFAVRAPAPPRPGEPDPGPFATRPPVEQRDETFVFRPAWYLEAELQPTRRLRIVPGARLDYARDSGHADFSPRLNGRYDLVPSMDEDEALGRRRMRTTLKGGVGVFHQPPDFQETDEVFGTPGVRSNRAIHYSLGVEQELSRQIELSLEGFYKDLAQLVARQAEPGGFRYTNDGTGYVVGMEALLKYKPDRRFFGWLAYTLSRSVRQDGPDLDPYMFFFDQTHNLVVLGSYRLGRGWEFGSRFRLVSGPLTTPVLGPPALPAIYAADSGSYVPLQGEPYSRRLPLFHQLDLRVDKRWQFREWRLSAYLDVQNVYNHQAVETLVYNYNYSQQTFQTGLPIIPSVGLRGEF
jgi:TonB family protein